MNFKACHRALGVPEVLARILDRTIRQPGEKEKYDWFEESLLMTKADPPWPFLLVSKYWHNVTLSTPSLWSTLVALLKECRYSEISHLPSMFDTHLRRSGIAPLTLVLRWSIISDSTFSTDENPPSDPWLPICALMQKAVE